MESRTTVSRNSREIVVPSLRVCSLCWTRTALKGACATGAMAFPAGPNPNPDTGVGGPVVEAAVCGLAGTMVANAIVTVERTQGRRFIQSLPSHVPRAWAG